MGGTVVSLTPEEPDEIFDGNKLEHKQLVVQWAREACVDAMWKKCYGAHIMSLCIGKKCSEVYPTLDGFLRDLNAAERLNADYQKNIVGK